MLRLIDGPLEDPRWREDARCRGMDPAVFHPTRGDSLAPALETCARCPVEVACLEYALLRGEQLGVWGGQAPKARMRERRRRGERLSCCAHCGRWMAVALRVGTVPIYCSDEHRDAAKAERDAERTERAARCRQAS